MKILKTRFGYELENNHAFLLGANFNTNTHLGFRETYMCLYLGSYTLTIGKCLWDTYEVEDYEM